MCAFLACSLAKLPQSCCSCFEIGGPWTAAEFPSEHNYIQHQITHISTQLVVLIFVHSATNSIFEESGLLRCYAVLLCKWFLLFWWVIVPTSSGWSSPEDMRNYLPGGMAVMLQETCVFSSTSVVVILFIIINISGRVLGLMTRSGPTNSPEVCWGLVHGFVSHTVDIS